MENNQNTNEETKEEVIKEDTPKEEEKINEEKSDNENKKEDHKNSKTGEKIMSVLAYLGILVLIPLFTSKNKPNVKFHTKQGLVLFSISVIIMILGYWIIPSMFQIIRILDLGVLILSIIGIVNAIQGKQKEIPLVGQFAKHFNFF